MYYVIHIPLSRDIRGCVCIEGDIYDRASWRPLPRCRRDSSQQSASHSLANTGDGRDHFGDFGYVY